MAKRAQSSDVSDLKVRQQRAEAATGTSTLGRRWLLMVYQLPSKTSNLRVRTWRRLQQLGAIQVKQAVYVRPDTQGAREDFEWLKTEIQGAGGDATVFAAQSVDGWSDDALVEEFKRARHAAYALLARDIERVLGRLAAKRSPGGRVPAGRRLVAVFRERLTAIEQVDFFGSAGQERVATMLKQLEDKTSEGRISMPEQGVQKRDARSFAGRLWVTRPRPGVDRMASAWLIRRFVDPRARFAFADDRDVLPRRAVAFDMFGADFSHHGDDCTIETLCSVFGITDPAVARVAAIVHDLDLKDGRFGAPEATTVGMLIEGLQLSITSDRVLLAHGMSLFESLYRAFERFARTAAPAARARQHKGRAAPRRRAGARKSSR